MTEIISGVVDSEPLSIKMPRSSVAPIRADLRQTAVLFLLAAIARGCSFRQVPVTFFPRQRGESFITNPFVFARSVISDLPTAFWRYNVVSRVMKRVKRA